MNKKTPATPTSSKPAPLKPELVKPEVDHSFDHEVAQDVRQQRIVDFIKRYGWLVGLALAALVAGTMYYQYQQQQQIAANQAASIQYDQFLNDAKDVDITAPGYQLLQQFAAAGKLFDTNKKQEAISAYLVIANDNAVNAIYQEQATILAGYAALETSTNSFTDTLKTALETIETSTSPWQYLSREVLAINALNKNDKELARSYLLALTDDNTAPESIRNRASELLPLATE